MILVTGTKRSGTSMWMQILINAGFPFIGSAYMGQWKESIQDANRKGFYESTLRYGINYTNNPHPDTGRYLHPRACAQHAVKIFIPGLVKTDMAFIHRVVATIRPWNEYASSIQRLLAMENEYASQKIQKEGGQSHQVKAVLRRANIHPALIWWRENFDLLFDVLTRKYPVHLVAYDRLLEAPEEVIPLVLQWCNSSSKSDLLASKKIGLFMEKAIETVDLSMRTQKKPIIEEHGIPSFCIETFDDLYQCFYSGGSRIESSLVQKLNQSNQLLEPLIKEQRQQGIKQKIEDLLNLGLSPSEIDQLLRKEKETIS